jgi:hypothetical protein
MRHDEITDRPGRPEPSLLINQQESLEGFAEICLIRMVGRREKVAAKNAVAMADDEK